MVEIAAIEKFINRGDSVSIDPNGQITIRPRGSDAEQLFEAMKKNADLEADLNRLRELLDTPETEEFDKAVPLEAAHQVKRWGVEDDAGKSPEDWFWLCGYLAGKALSAFKAGDVNKAKHHCISTAAAMRNWHAHLRIGQTAMRPGISAVKAAVGGQE